jgi:ketol-acid reductoisomerase
VARVFTEADVNLGPIQGRKIAVVGYGAQGHAHALNLRDSGATVRVGLRAGGSASRERALVDGFAVQTVDEVCAWGDLIAVLAPDQAHRAVFEADIRPHLKPDDVVMTAAAFSVQYGLVIPPSFVDVILIAPVGPGSTMRRLFTEGHGVPGLFAVHQDVSGHATSLALSYAAALGCMRVGVLETTFEEETATDLFGEQAVLCGGLSALIKAGFDTLVNAGYQPELAYFECLHQVKLIADLIQEGGLSGMHLQISDTAEFGDYVTGPRIVDSHVRQSMQRALRDIQDGTFARAWIEESESGTPTLRRVREVERDSEIERVGARLRRLMQGEP